MPKRMLIDATHPEETRVVVINGTRLEEFDFESSTKRQVKGNIYLAKVTRVEPSLQAAFIEYGGNRHGFLAFSEIHPDYYRIPVIDRLQASTDPARRHDEDERETAANGEDAGVPLAAALPESVQVPQAEAEDDFPSDEAADTADNAPQATAEAVHREDAAEAPPPWEPPSEEPLDASTVPASEHPGAPDADALPEPGTSPAAPVPAAIPAETGHDPTASALHAAAATIVVPDIGQPSLPDPQTAPTADTGTAWREAADTAAVGEPPAPRPAVTPSGWYEAAATEEKAASGHDSATIALRAAEEIIVAEIPATGDTAMVGDGERPGEPDAIGRDEASADIEHGDGDEVADAAETVETLGGDEVEEVEEADAAERRQRHPMRHYKIQEVIKRRQIMLVQVAKEERGNKGAALTTYLSLAGRYCVLMPNTNRGGGVSRKITSLADRRRLKDILEELDIPEGMGVIVRTAGAERSKAEIKRDYEYLLRLWNEIRDLTLRSTAPALIYEEGNLIKRSIRDLYTRDIDEVLVEGEEGYRTAKAFMRTLMPSHAKRVQPYRDPQISLFHRFQVESQIDAIHSPIAQLRSGGYLVINQTEALVAIDVNSGRATRERNIEETALRTNLEAAEEIARQLRLRDLAGLIVIDFIDMEEHRNQIAVERRLKEALKNDRARIQVGRISPFGLLEMSRQRLRPSLTETSTQPCPHCGGTGFIRSVESTALHVLRSIEEEGMRRRSAEICVYVPTTVALYILNQKRDSLNQIETRYGLRVMVARDDALIPPAFRLERLRPYGLGEAPPARPIQAPSLPDYDEEEDEADESREDESELASESETTTAESGGNGPERSAEDERARRRRRRRRRRDERGDTRHAASPAGADDETEGAEADEAAEREEPAETAREGDGEAERRRRRRGRRGGRPHPRRGEPAEEIPAAIEAETETEAETPVAAVETIEIVAAPAPPVAAMDETLPLVPWSGAYDIEAASLAPLAGEPAAVVAMPPEPTAATVDGASPQVPAAGFQEAEVAAPETAPTAEAEEGVPFVSAAERELETEAGDHPAVVTAEPARPEAETMPEPVVAAAAESGATAAAGAVTEPVWRAVEAAADAAATPPPTATVERGAVMPAAPVVADLAGSAEPVAAATAPVAVAAAPEPPEPAAPVSPVAPPRSAEDVLVVTEKPANPRRGWWQRMIRS